MARKIYDDKEREKIRAEFANYRNKGHSIAASSKLAGISPSTFYGWNKEDGWTKVNGWDKNGWTKENGGWVK